MGLGVGMHCAICKEQLNLDDDGSQVMRYRQVDEEGRDLRDGPVGAYCARCEALIKAVGKFMIQGWSAT